MNKKGRVRIISEDGTTANTQLLDAESGEDLNLRARKVVLIGDCSTEETPRMWQAEIYTYLPLFDVLANAEIFQVCRFCKQTLPTDWKGQNTHLAAIVKFNEETEAARKKPLSDALDFHHDIERARGKLASLLTDETKRDEFPLGYGVTIIEKYEEAIHTFLGENDEEVS